MTTPRNPAELPDPEMPGSGQTGNVPASVPNDPVVPTAPGVANTPDASGSSDQTPPPQTGPTGQSPYSIQAGYAPAYGQQPYRPPASGSGRPPGSTPGFTATGGQMPVWSARDGYREGYVAPGSGGRPGQAGYLPHSAPPAMSGRTPASYPAPQYRPQLQGVPLRITSAERQHYVDVVSEAFVAGQLTNAELDQRLEGILGARTSGELMPYVADIGPATGMQTVPRQVPPVKQRKKTSGGKIAAIIVGIVAAIGIGIGVPVHYFVTQGVEHVQQVAGDDVQVITSMDELPGSLSRDAGSITLDLTQLEVTEDATLDVQVDIGEIVVQLPENQNIEVNYHVDVGSYDGNNSADGVGVEGSENFRNGDPDGPTLVLNLEVDAGSITVYN